MVDVNLLPDNRLSKMFANNSGFDSFDNNSFTFYGPMDMAIDDDDDTVLEGPEIKLVLSIILSLILLLSVLGNVCTCAVIIRYSHMRTPTHGYLFNIAVTDLLLSLFIPIELFTIWQPDYYPLGLVGCYVHVFLTNVLVHVSVLTIAAFTIERYLVISRPFLCKFLTKMSRIYKIVGCIWIISISFTIPEMFAIDFLERKKYTYCFTTLSSGLRVFIMAHVFVMFIGPMNLIVTLYILIAVKLKDSKLRRSPANGILNREKAVRMLVAVTGSFFFCWTPFVMMRIMMALPQLNIEEYYDLWRVVNYVSLTNGYLSTSINPILYSLMSMKFRQSFKAFLGAKTALPSRVEGTKNPWCTKY